MALNYSVFYSLLLSILPLNYTFGYIMPLQAYRPAPHLNLTGALERNHRLCSAERLLDGLLSGPESLAENDGFLYAGLNGGHVVRIDVDTQQISSVTKFGMPCDGNWEEEICGRPVGLKFDPDGFLIAADMYNGIFRVDIATGNSTQLVSVNDVIDGRKPGLPNNLDIGRDGSIYWSDSTTVTNFRNSIIEFIADASGRVIRYNPATRSNVVLIKDMRFPNGISLSPDETYLLVAETGRNRILRYFISGEKQGKLDIFVEGLPGGPDGLRRTPEGHYLAALITNSNPERASLPEALGPYPGIRGAVLAFVTGFQRFLANSNRKFPFSTARRVTHVLGHTESLFRDTMDRSILVLLDEDGRVVDSLQCSGGDVRYISEALQVGNFYYLASPFNNYLGRLKLSAKSELYK